MAPFMAQAANLKETSSEPYTIKASDLAKKEKELTDFPLMASVKETIQTLDNAQVELIERAGRRTRTTLNALKGL